MRRFSSRPFCLPGCGELTRLVDQDPDNAVARTNLGVIILQLGKVEQARAQLEAALRSDPGLDTARQALEFDKAVKRT